MNGFNVVDEESHEFYDEHFVCCLIDKGLKCQQLASNASYNKRIERCAAAKKLQYIADPQSGHNYICDYHKSVIQNVRSKRKRRDSDEEDNEIETDIPDVDFYQLQVNTLRRYKRHYKITTKPGLNKAQLVDILMKHFKTIPVKERDILTYFIYNIKNNNGRDIKNYLQSEI